nr:MAG TPA: hypothetical protein [Caudoviricetes sp.]
MPYRGSPWCGRHPGWKSIRCRMDQYPCLDYRHW